MKFKLAAVMYCGIWLYTKQGSDEQTESDS